MLFFRNIFTALCGICPEVGKDSAEMRWIMSYQRNDFKEKDKAGKKGFYWSLCTALVCLMTVGTVYYRTNHLKTDGDFANRIASEVTQQPVDTPAGGSSIAQKDVQTEGIDEKEQLEESQQASAITNGKQGTKNNISKKSKTSKSKKTENPKESVATMTKKEEIVFQEEKGLLWPVKGEVIMKYSKSNNVYFKTLAQYRANPAIAIQAKEGENVVAAATGKITEISKTEENGTIVTVSIGNGYTVSYGQLKDIKVSKGQSIQEGEVIGKIAAPTKYFSEEGSHLYFQVMQKQESVDPLLLLR